MDMAGILHALLFCVFIGGSYALDPCPTNGDTIGHNQYNLFLSNDRSVWFGYLVTGSYLTATCSGVVVEWSVNVLEAGTLHVQVWRPVNQTDHQFKLMGELSLSVNPGVQTIPVTDRSLQIPIKVGDSIGWYAASHDILKFYQTPGYHDYYTVDMAAQVNFTQGRTYIFTPKSQTSRAYGINLKITPGAPPEFTNLPANISISETTPVNKRVFTVTAADKNTLEVINFYLNNTENFNINTDTGEVTVKQDLRGSEATQEMTVIASDGVYEVSETLTVYVIIETTLVPTTTVQSTMQPKTAETSISGQPGGTSTPSQTPTPTIRRKNNARPFVKTTAGIVTITLLSVAAVCIIICIVICCLTCRHKKRKRPISRNEADMNPKN